MHDFRRIRLIRLIRFQIPAGSQTVRKNDVFGTCSRKMGSRIGPAPGRSTRAPKGSPGQHVWPRICKNLSNNAQMLGFQHQDSDFSKTRKMCFSPHGSVWSFKGEVLLRFSLGLAVRTFWSDLEKFPKSASGKILGQHSGSGTFLG